MAAPPPTEKPAWLDQAPSWLAPPPATAPVVPPPQVGEAPPEASAWAATPRRSSGSRVGIYLAGVVLVALISAGGIFVRGQILAMRANNDQQLVATSPTPFLSDYERADRFLNIDLTSSMAGAVGPMQALEKNCTPSTMTPACKDALVATDKAMTATLDVINKADIPTCIAREVLQFKNDWMGMEQGVAMAISGYTYNSRDLYLQGFVKFAKIAQYYQPDVDRVTTAEKACSKLAR